MLVIGTPQKGSLIQETTMFFQSRTASRHKQPKAWPRLPAQDFFLLTVAVETPEMPSSKWTKPAAPERMMINQLTWFHDAFAAVGIILVVCHARVVLCLVTSTDVVIAAVLSDLFAVASRLAHVVHSYCSCSCCC